MDITVEIRYEDDLELLEVPVRDVEIFIQLIRKYGYEDDEGQIYKFSTVRVEYPKTVRIYLELDE